MKQRPDLNILAKDLKVTLKKQWFDRHLKDKHEEYRSITPFWIRRLLCKKDGTRLSTTEVSAIYDNVKSSGNIEGILHGILFGGLTFTDYKTFTAYNGGYMSEALPYFTKTVKTIGVGKGKPDLGAPTENVFIISTGDILIQPHSPL